MQVSVEITDGLQRRMTVGVPKERVAQEYQTRLHSVARKTKINGFRPGKAPLRVIQQRYGTQIRQEAIEEILRHSLQEAVTQENLRIAGAPELEVVNDKGESEDLDYIVTFEVYPEISEIQMNGIRVEKPLVEIADEDIDNMILSLRRQRQSWEKVDRPAQKDDRLELDYNGTLNGEAFDGGNATRQQLIIGSGRYLDNFENALIGASANSTVEFDVDFPADYRQSELAGQKVHFSALIHEVYAPLLPEMDEDLARTFGIEEGGVEALRQEVVENLKIERDKEIKNQLKKQLFERLSELNPIQVPQALVRDEAERMAQSFQRELQAQGLRFTQVLESAKFESAAQPRVKMGLLLGELIRKQEFKADPKKVYELLESIASTYEDPQAYIHWHYAKPERLANIEAVVLEDMVMEWALEHVEVIEKPISFKELMESRQKTA
jgi:trigger factor